MHEVEKGVSEHIYEIHGTKEASRHENADVHSCDGWWGGGRV